MWDFADQLAEIQREGRLRRAVPVTPDDSQDPWLVRVGEQRARVFCSNDYLGLRHDPRVIEAGCEALRRYGSGSGSARQLSGDWPPLHELERELADFLEVEACLLFSSGYLANLGAIPVLAEEGDVIFSDERNHASLIDGCRLSRARIVVFRHADVEDLERKLRAYAGRCRLLVTESLYSMDGDLAPLADYAALAPHHELEIFVDDAHALGTMDLASKGIALRMGTLSKSLGSQGAFVAGTREAIELLRNRARTHLFETALVPSAAAAALASLRVLRAESSHREKLHARARQLRETLASTTRSTKTSISPILPLLVGEEAATTACAQWMLDRGFFLAAIRPPTVAPGTSRLRITLSAAHTEKQVEELGRTLLEARQRFPWVLPD